MYTVIKGVHHPENRQKARDIEIRLYKGGPTVLAWDDGRSFITRDKVTNIWRIPREDGVETLTFELGKEQYTIVTLNGTYTKILVEQFEILI